MALVKSKSARKPILNPEEIALNFKENKFDNANGILELLLQLETSSGHFLLDCIFSVTDVTLQIIKDGDLTYDKHQKHDDLKDALEKYRDWIQQRFKDIIAKFIVFLHHPKSSVSERAMSSLSLIMQHLAWESRLFPNAIYLRVLAALLSPKVDCRKIINTLKEPLQYADLVFVTLKCLRSLLRNSPPDLTPTHISNLVALLLLIRVPPKDTNSTKQELWCSTRKSSKAALKKAKAKHRSKTALKNKQCRGGDSDEEDGVGDGNVGESREGKQKGEMEEKKWAVADDDLDLISDSDSEQRQKDDKEFKSGQKVKPQRKRKLPEFSDEYAEDLEEPEDPNQIVIPERKKMHFISADGMMPIEASSPEDYRVHQLLMEYGMEHREVGHHQEDGASYDDVHEFDGVPRELRGPLFKYVYQTACSLVTKIWDQVMMYNLSDDQYKRCLVFIPEHVMDHHKDPVKMTDFFLTSYNRGGGISLMAMHGVFLLMHKHNLQYPDFYSKVYRLLDPSVMNARYKGRFFVLLSMFLSSSHLPQYIAAAFLKRLSLLALRAPANCSLLLAKCINNLIVRFPALRPMYDDPNGVPVAGDPYNVFERDLKYCGAAESSLWEVATLSRAANERLYKATYFINRTSNTEEVDISKHLETGYEEMDLSTAASTSNVNNAAVNFKYVGKLVGGGADSVATFFC